MTYEQLIVLQAIVTEGTFRGAAERLNKSQSAISHMLKKLETENASLRKRVITLENQVDASEQYSRRNLLRISGVPEFISAHSASIADPLTAPREDTDSFVLQMCEDLGVDMSLSEIDRSHRVGNGKKKPRDILVKFATYRSRNRLYKSRSKAKDNAKYTKVYVNEDLTKERSRLLYEARKLVKDEKFVGAWSYDGTILVKLPDDPLLHRVNTAEDLSKLFQTRRINDLY